MYMTGFFGEVNSFNLIKYCDTHEQDFLVINISYNWCSCSWFLTFLELSVNYEEGIQCCILFRK